MHGFKPFRVHGMRDDAISVPWEGHSPRRSAAKTPGASGWTVIMRIVSGFSFAGDRAFMGSSSVAGGKDGYYPEAATQTPSV